MIEAPFPAHKAILKEKKADLVVGVLPFSYDPELNEFARPLFTTQSGIGRIALSFWTARKPFIDKNRAALVDLLEDYGAILRWYHDPANHKEAVALTAAFLKRPPAAFEPLAVHQAGLLPRSRRQARPQGGAGQRRQGEGARLHQGDCRRAEIRRPEPGRRGRQASALEHGCLRLNGYALAAVLLIAPRPLRPIWKA